MTNDLLDIFKAHKSIVCCVGAGGKKTTMFRLAREHPGRVGITATSHIELFPRKLKAKKYIDEEEKLLRLINKDKTSPVIAFACPSSRKGRHAGISRENVLLFREAGNFNLMVLKCDGARSRLIKAPADHEPPIPACADVVIPVISARCIGKKLTEKLAHRPEYLEKITGLKLNDTIRPIHIARLLTSDQGSLKNCQNARVIPLINMVDNSVLEKNAREAAESALGMTDRFDYVVLAAMREEQPVKAVIY